MYPIITAKVNKMHPMYSEITSAQLDKLHKNFDALVDSAIEIYTARLEYYITHLPPCPKCKGEGHFGYHEFQIGEDEFTGAFISCSRCGFKVTQPSCQIGLDFKLFKIGRAAMPCEA